MEQDENLGGFCFGLVFRWFTYRTLRRNSAPVVISDISSVIAAVGGAAITALFGTKVLFGYYSIGLAAGFFLYLIIAALIGKQKVDDWMNE